MEINKKTIIGMADGPTNIFIKDTSLENDEIEDNSQETKNKKKQ